MTTFLLVLTAIFVLYIIYLLFFSTSDFTAQFNAAIRNAEEKKLAQQAAPTETDETAAPVEQPAAAESTPDEAPTTATEPGGYRHPDTGEEASIPTNYRFAKRWLKDALVQEGLLDRVYKNNELDETISEKVKEALERFKSLTKYHKPS